MSKVVIFLVGLAFILTGLTTISSPGEDEGVTRDFYNEVIDERSAEDRLTPAERQRRMIEDLGRQLRETAGEPQQRGQQPSPDPGSVAPVPVPAPGEAPPPPPEAAPEAATTTIIRAEAPDQAAEMQNRPTLGIEPTSPDIFVGQEQLFQVRLHNPGRIPYNALAFAIQYDPSALEVLDQMDTLPGVNIQDASAAEIGLDTRPVSRVFLNEVDSGRGLIIFRAEVRPGINSITEDGILARFKVRALRERGSTTLQFTGIHRGNAIDRILDEAAREGSTFLRMIEGDNRRPLDFPVLSYGAQARILPSRDGQLVAGEDLDLHRTSLRLEPNKSQVSIGEQFDVLVHLDNPERISFDAISLYLRYDPRVLKPIDMDSGNLITEGINIGDGEFYDQFPFELCRANRINPDTGEIIYSMESFSEPISADGPFARIRFEAIRPVRSTSLLFGFNMPGRFPTTSVTRMRRDMLAKGDDFRDGVYSSPISIIP